MKDLLEAIFSSVSESKNETFSGTPFTNKQDVTKLIQGTLHKLWRNYKKEYGADAEIGDFIADFQDNAYMGWDLFLQQYFPDWEYDAQKDYDEIAGLMQDQIGLFEESSDKKYTGKLYNFSIDYSKIKDNDKREDIPVDQLIDLAKGNEKLFADDLNKIQQKIKNSKTPDKTREEYINRYLYHFAGHMVDRVYLDMEKTHKRDFSIEQEAEKSIQAYLLKKYFS